MADVFTNDLRIREQEVGANSGAWGGYLNVSLSNLAESWSYGTEALADSAAQTLTLADGASDELRSFYVKLTGTLSQATTVTLAPNTISKVWMIENATTGGYAVTISQGSGANVVVGNGNVKMIATDGAGAGGVVHDLLTDLELAGNVSITTADNTTQLTLKSTDADANTGPVLNLQRDSGSPADNDYIGNIKLQADNDSGEVLDHVSILGQIVDASDGTEDAKLTTYVLTAGTVRNALEINPTEIVINEDSIDRNFRVESDANTNALFVDGGQNAIGIQTATEHDGTALVYPLTINAGNHSGNALEVHRTTNSRGYWYASDTGTHYLDVYGSSSPNLRFRVAGSDVAKVTSAGICFGSDTAAANALDDYEEGTWTPTVQSTGTAAFSGARYTKVGRMVTVHYYVHAIGNTSSSASWSNSLPFTAAANNVAATLGFMGVDISLGVLSSAYLGTTNTVHFYSNSSSTAYQVLEHSHFGSNTAFYVSFTYMAA